ncbi:hypothetical protein ACT4Y0_15195 [Acinetobacter baumannii]
MYQKLKAIRQSYDEYVLKFDSFPDLIFIGRNYFHDLFNEVESLKRNGVNYWKIRSGSTLNNYDIYGCKLIVINEPFFAFGFFEFDDLDKIKDLVIADEYRNSADRLSIAKIIENVDYRPRDLSQIPRPTTDTLDIPFFVIDAFKLENITKKEIEQRKNDYQIRKGIYEPEISF